MKMAAVSTAAIPFSIRPFSNSSLMLQTLATGYGSVTFKPLKNAGFTA